MSAPSVPLSEEWQFHEDDGDMIMSPTSKEFPASMPMATAFDHAHYMDIADLYVVGEDFTVSQPHAALWGDFSNHSFLLDEVEHWDGILSPSSSQQLAAALDANFHNTQTSPSEVSDEYGTFRDQEAILIDSAGPTAYEVEDQGTNNNPQMARPEPKCTARRRPRTQNRSCDPCRSGKKACDLQMSIVIDDKKPSTPCSTCNVRGVECTVAWLASRQSSQQIKKRAQSLNLTRTPVALPGGGDGMFQVFDRDRQLLDTLGPESTNERDLVRQFTARQTCSQQFHLYIDVVEVPLAECLARGSMPPTFPQGIAALSPLSTNLQSAVYWNEARSWLQDCWEMKSIPWTPTTRAPHIFLAVGILDALFQAPTLSSSRPAPTASRSAAINETYKWVALAAATQFVLSNDEDTNGRARDLASTTWHKAKQLLFSNMAAVGSFRLALSLMLFGAILPPASPGGDNTNVEDARFAHCEGIRRLQELCFHARACIRRGPSTDTWAHGIQVHSARQSSHPAQLLPREARENVLELIGSIQWLVVMSNTVSIASSQGTICAMSPQMEDNKAGRLLFTRETIPDPGAPSSEKTGRYDQAIQESILTRPRAEPQPITALWRRDTEYEVVTSALRESAAVVVLLFHTLALLTVDSQTMPEDEDAYNLVHRHLSTLVKLGNVWRNGFGRFEKATSSQNIRQSGQLVRQFVFFCSNDGDLAILLFYKAMDRLERQLASHLPSLAKEKLWAAIQSTKPCRTEQRLTSAIQISFLASAARDLAKENHNSQDQLRDLVQDIAAHPVC